MKMKYGFMAAIAAFAATVASAAFAHVFDDAVFLIVCRHYYGKNSVCIFFCITHFSAPSSRERAAAARTDLITVAENAFSARTSNALPVVPAGLFT